MRRDGPSLGACSRPFRCRRALTSWATRGFTTTLTALEFLPIEEQPGYSMWDFDLTYSTAHDRFFVGGYVNNAFDKTALSFSFPTPLSTFMTATLQHPRTFGVRTGVHF